MLRIIINSSYISNSFRSYSNLLRDQMRTPNVGKELGRNFERDIQSLLLDCDYHSTFCSNTDFIGNVFINTQKTSSEFDAFVSGGKHSFDKFQDSFKTSFSKFPPSGDAHSAIVEIKLNVKSVKDWIEDKETGSRFLFFNSNPLFTRILVINGEEESEEFVKSLSFDECKDEYKEVKAAIIDFKINVFYKMWASGEVFTKILLDNEILKSDNAILKSDNAILKSDNAILKSDNNVLLTKYENIESDLMLLKKHLNIK